MDKDTRKLLQEAERQGFEVRLTKRGHPMVYLNGKYVTGFSGTPGDVRAIRNSLAALRRAGFDWPK